MTDKILPEHVAKHEPTWLAEARAERKSALLAAVCLNESPDVGDTLLRIEELLMVMAFAYFGERDEAPVAAE